MFFEMFPKIDYNLSSVDSGFSVSMSDVFRRIKFTDNTLLNTRNFIEYQIKDGETPENVAFDFYEGVSWSWLVLLSTNIIDTTSEWPKSSYTIQREMIDPAHLGGRSYFIHDFKNFQSGDIICQSTECTPSTTCEGGINASLDNYAVVDKWHPELFRIDSTRIVGNIEQNDYITILRKQSDENYAMVGGESGCTPNPLQSQIKKVTKLSDSVHSFVLGENKISGFVDSTDLSTFDYSGKSLCDAPNSLIYKYINGDDIPVSVITEKDNVLHKNDKKRNIRLIHPSLKREIYNEMKTLISSRYSTNTTILIERK
jgi:hypothetical protein